MGSWYKGSETEYGTKTLKDYTTYRSDEEDEEMDVLEEHYSNPVIKT